MDNPVRNPFTKSKDRNRSEDREYINRTEYSTAEGGEIAAAVLELNYTVG